MSALVTLVGLVVTLSVVVFVHELGHLVAAKRAKVVVQEFGLGYPPRLFAFWRSEGAIVINGKRIIVPRGFDLPRDLRALTSVAYRTATDSKGREILTHIEEIAPGYEEGQGTGFVDHLDGGTIYTLNAVPFGGFAKMLGEEDPTYPGSLASKGKLARIVVLAAGATMNVLTAVIFFALAFRLGAPVVADPENAVIVEVAPGSPAEAAGLEVGDIILAADDTSIDAVVDILRHTRDNLGREIVLTVQRDEDLLTIPVVPRPEPPEEEGPVGIALSPRMTVQKFGWGEALWSGLRQTVSYVGLIITIPVQIIRGLVPADLARPVGPVGVGRLVGDAVQYSMASGWWFPVMQMIGTLSIALAVTNLLPLPGLDGGRILFVIIEAIRGRRVDPAKENLVHLIGLLLLVALMLFITWQDLINPVPGLDWSRFF
jgi:regulator of sigma E protease